MVASPINIHFPLMNKLTYIYIEYSGHVSDLARSFLQWDILNWQYGERSSGWGFVPSTEESFFFSKFGTRYSMAMVQYMTPIDLENELRSIM